MVLSFHPETARCVQSTAFSNQRMETAASIVREDENFANTAAEALRFGHNAHIQDFLGCARFLLSDFDHLHHAVPAKNINLFRGADRLPAFRANQLTGTAGACAARCGTGSCLGCSPGSSRADKGR